MLHFCFTAVTYEVKKQLAHIFLPFKRGVLQQGHPMIVLTFNVNLLRFKEFLKTYSVTVVDLLYGFRETFRIHIFYSLQLTLNEANPKLLLALFSIRNLWNFV